MASPAGPAGAPPDKAPAAAAEPQPPPEKPSDARRRSYIILSFWLLVVLLGLPVWWQTTSIYRADLPLSDMMNWADGKSCNPVFPLQVAVEADALQEKEAQSLLRLTQRALDDLNDFPAHQLHLRLAPKRSTDDAPLNADSALTVRLVPGDTMTTTLDPHLPILEVAYRPSSIPSDPSTSPLATFIATELHSTFEEERAILSYLLSSSAMASSTNTTLPPETVAILEKRTTRAFRYAHTYHLTFSLFTAGPAPSTWDIESAVNAYMKPVLDVLRPIHNFTIDTQVQLYASPGVQSNVLSPDDLASFINAAEWPLSPSIGGAPTVNFVLYIGNQTVSVSETETSQSWLIPQWGAVYLLPLPPAPHLPAEALKPSPWTPEVNLVVARRQKFSLISRGFKLNGGGARLLFGEKVGRVRQSAAA